MIEYDADVAPQQRVVRASSIHGLAGMAAIMASTYKAYLGEGLGDFGKWLMQFKIPHFGRVSPPSPWVGGHRPQKSEDGVICHFFACASAFLHEQGRLCGVYYFVPRELAMGPCTNCIPDVQFSE